MIKNENDLKGQFFVGKTDSLIKSIMERRVGDVWTDNLDTPTMIFASDGSYGYFDGIVTDDFIQECIEQIIRDTGRITIIPHGKYIQKAIGSYLRNRSIKDGIIIESKEYNVSTNKRFLMEPANGMLDKFRLGYYLSLLPKNMSMVAIDASLFKKIKIDKEVDFLLEQYESYEVLSSIGQGYVILDGDIIVAGAVPYSKFSNGIEVEYMTREAYRGNGYATIVAARLLTYCLENNLEAVWDAAHLASVSVAEKLGYTLAKEYEAYTIKDKGL